MSALAGAGTGDIVKLAVGGVGVFTFTDRVDVDCAPRASVTVSATGNTDTVRKMCVVVIPVDVVPSPKLHE
jgi:hypothetical protein